MRPDLAARWAPMIDFEPIVPYLDLDPDIELVHLPHAPERAVTING